MCHSTGLPPISIIGLGRIVVSSLIRVPRPPARMTAFMELGDVVNWWFVEDTSNESRRNGQTRLLR